MRLLPPRRFLVVAHHQTFDEIVARRWRRKSADQWIRTQHELETKRQRDRARWIAKHTPPGGRAPSPGPWSTPPRYEVQEIDPVQKAEAR